MKVFYYYQLHACILESFEVNIYTVKSITNKTDCQQDVQSFDQNNLHSQTLFDESDLIKTHKWSTHLSPGSPDLNLSLSSAWEWIYHYCFCLNSQTRVHWEGQLPCKCSQLPSSKTARVYLTFWPVLQCSASGKRV